MGISPKKKKKNLQSILGMWPSQKEEFSPSAPSDPLLLLSSVAFISVHSLSISLSLSPLSLSLSLLPSLSHSLPFFPSLLTWSSWPLVDHYHIHLPEPHTPTNWVQTSSKLSRPTQWLPNPQRGGACHARGRVESSRL